jgi:hypothetical protein
MKSVNIALSAILSLAPSIAAGQAAEPATAPPAARIVPPPAPPPPPAPGSPAFARQQADRAERLRLDCLSERGIRIILEHEAASQAAARAGRDESVAVSRELAEAALTVPVDLDRLERALAADAALQSAHQARRSRDALALLRRLSPGDRAIYARNLTAMRMYPPQRTCLPDPARQARSRRGG